MGSFIANWNETLHVRTNYSYAVGTGRPAFGGQVSWLPLKHIQKKEGRGLLNELQVRSTFSNAPTRMPNLSLRGANLYAPADESALSFFTLGLPEIGNMQEATLGLHLRAFQRRIMLDVTAYRKENRGAFGHYLEPAVVRTYFGPIADMRSQGIEATARISPFKRQFKWEWGLTFTQNQDQLLDLVDGLNQFDLTEGEVNLTLVEEGMGPLLYGNAFVRDEAGAIVYEGGIPQESREPEILGSIQENFRMSIFQTLSWKGFRAYAQFDWVKGGLLYHPLAAELLARGFTVETEENRELPFVGNGVQADGNPNDVPVFIGDLAFGTFFGSGPEGAIFDRTQVRLREVSLAYTLPQHLLDHFWLKGISLNLWGHNLWHRALGFPEGIQVDPELNGQGIGEMRAIDISSGGVGARRYGVRLSLDF